MGAHLVMAHLTEKQSAIALIPTQTEYCSVSSDHTFHQPRVMNSEQLVPKVWTFYIDVFLSIMAVLTEIIYYMILSLNVLFTF